MQLAFALLQNRQNAAHMHPRFEPQLLHQFRRRFFRRAVEDLRALRLLRHIDAIEPDRSGCRLGQLRRGNSSDLFGLRLLDAHQRGVAQLRRAGLNRQQRGQRHFDMLKPAVFQFALHLDPAAVRFDVHDDRGVRQPHHFGQDDAGLAVAEIVGLQAGQDQIGLLRFERASPSCGRATRGSVDSRLSGFDVDRAIRAFRQSFANGLRGALRPRAKHHHFAAVSFSLSCSPASSA